MNFPEYILVAGGGRWARVYISNLLAILPPTLNILVFSPSNQSGIMSWAKENRFSSRLKAVGELPEWSRSEAGCSVLIIVNAAKDHLKLIEWAISNQIPVLCEKPITASPEKTLLVASLVQTHKHSFAAAHVFLFTEYLENFRKCIGEGDGINEIEFSWCDALEEKRYGESKKYDASLPIHFDCIPHIYSILYYLTGEEQASCNQIFFSEGGSELNANLFFGPIPCRVLMKRNAPERRRFIRVISANQTFTLDFTNEPGKIFINSNAVSTENHWNHSLKPIGLLLSAFFAGLINRDKDDRLDIRIGLNAAILTKEIDVFYQDEFKKWFFNNSDLSGKNRAMEYFLNETILRYGGAKLVSSSILIKTYQLLKNNCTNVNDFLSMDIQDCLQLSNLLNENQVD